MNTKSKLLLAALAVLAMGASSAFARGHDDLAPPPACDDLAVDGFCGPNAQIGTSFTVAKNGADDLVPEGLDDNGVDPLPHALNGLGILVAKHGADNLVPEAEGPDDNGVDFIIVRNGADDVLPEAEGLDNNGVDAIPA